MVHTIDNAIRLVPIEEDHAPAIFKAFDRDVIKHLPIDAPPGKIEETVAFVKYSREQMKRGVDLVWVILFENQFAGCRGIHDIPSKQPHFGLWIKTELQGKGIGKKVVHYVLDWGISNLDVEYIKYPVDRKNVRSIKLLHGLGLTLSDNYEMGNTKKLDVIEYRLYKS